LGELLWITDLGEEKASFNYLAVTSLSFRLYR
jgi:hypothetical protein